MEIIKVIRKNCVLDNKSEIKPYLKLQNYPVKMTCTDRSSKTDIFMDMEWGISSNGIIQLLSMVPLEILYNDSHNPGTIGKTWKEHHDSLSTFIKKDFKGDRILEIGAASGLLVDRFLDLKDDFSWDIVEPSNQNYVDKRINHHKIIFEDFNSDNKYDIVIHSHLLEHVYDPISFLLKINSIIRKGGIQYISIPNIPHYLEKGFSNALNFEHTYFYNYEILDILLTSCGFKIVEKVNGEHSIFLKTKKIDAVSKQKNISYKKTDESERLFDNYLSIMNSTVENVDSIKEKYKEIFIFGGHVFSQSLLNLGLDKLNISGILDNDPNKQNKRLYGTNLNVFDPSHIKDKDKTLVIIKAGAYTQEITKQIISINNKVDIL